MQVLSTMIGDMQDFTALLLSARALCALREDEEDSDAGFPWPTARC
jgi:hypothetical protein